MDGAILKNSPFRSPRWRYLRVIELLRHRPEPLRPRRPDDHPVRAYWWFLKNAANAVLEGDALDKLSAELPHVAAAHGIHYSPDIELRQILEARLLTSESFAEIAHGLGVEPPVIEYYEQLFFNVRDRMQASIWILKVILGPPQARNLGKDGAMTVEQRGFLYRLFAYYGGPLILDALISGIGGLTMPTRPEDVDAWFTDAFSQLLKSRGAAAAALVEIRSNNALKLIKLAVREAPKRKARMASRHPGWDEANLEMFLAAIEPILKPEAGAAAAVNGSPQSSAGASGDPPLSGPRPPGPG